MEELQQKRCTRTCFENELHTFYHGAYIIHRAFCVTKTYDVSLASAVRSSKSNAELLPVSG